MKKTQHSPNTWTGDQVTDMENAMADSGRSINVKLSADVDQYVASMERARVATSALAAELRACGITEADLPRAIQTALRIVKDEDGDPKFAVAI